MSNATKITITNESELAATNKYQDLADKRIALVPVVKDFITNHTLFAGKEVSVTFALKGVSSFISILESQDTKVVLKMPLGKIDAASEAHFLRVWTNIGVRTPRVIETGSIGVHPYILMEFVDAPIVVEIFNEDQLLENRTYVEMGALLRKMHEPHAIGYGMPINEGKGQFETFREWVFGKYMQEKLQYVQEHQLLTVEYGSLENAIELLCTYIDQQTYSSYCHYDLSMPNIFATDPITVFDPNPAINDSYFDLGRTLVLAIARGSAQPACDQILEGYFQHEPYDTKLIQASVLLNAYQKFQYWHQKGKLERMQRVQEYLRTLKDI